MPTSYAGFQSYQTTYAPQRSVSESVYNELIQDAAAWRAEVMEGATVEAGQEGQVDRAEYAYVLYQATDPAGEAAIKTLKDGDSTYTFMDNATPDLVDWLARAYFHLYRAGLSRPAPVAGVMV